MKISALKIIFIALLLIIFQSIEFPAKADPPSSPPPPPPHGLNDDQAAGGGAPIDGGISTLLILCVFYGAKKINMTIKKEKD